MIDAGTLRDKVVMMRRVVVQNEAGEQVAEWMDEATIHAKVTYLKGANLLTAGIEGWNRDTISILIRYRDAWNEHYHVRWDGKVYEVTSCNSCKSDGSTQISAQRLDDK